MNDDVPAEEVRRIMDKIFDVPPRREPVHQHDCAPCDLASEVAGCIAAMWDEDEVWDETTVTDGLTGDTKLDQLTRIVAHVLHRRMPGYRRPPQAAINAEIIADLKARGIR